MSSTLTQNTVELGQLAGLASDFWAGEPWGAEVRLAAGLDDYDRDENAAVILEIPTWVRIVTSSFMRGLVRPSLLHLEEEGFRRKYRFVGKDVNTVLEDEIVRAKRFMRRQEAREPALVYAG